MQAVREIQSGMAPWEYPGNNRRGRGSIRIAFWAFAILAGALQGWVLRHTIQTDGISYLDISDAVMRGDWSGAVNGYWSPLYPLLLAVGRSIITPAPQSEFAVLHLVNFAIYLFALTAFEFLLRSILACRGRFRKLPDWLLLIAGYCLFCWTSLDLITVGVSSPDMAVAAFVFLAAACLVRIAAGSARWTTFFGLGLALGLGYLSKAVVFPIAFLFLAVAAIAVWRLRERMTGLAVAAAAFVVVCSAFVIPLSLQKGRFTFGDTGKLNYCWYVDGAAYRHWQGQPLGPELGPAPKWTAGPVSSGVPAHPTRMTLEAPPVYEFNGPVGGTYPVWFDPSYWNEGIRPRFDLRQQLRKIVINGKFLYSVLANPHLIQLYQEKRLSRFFSPLFLGILAFLSYWSIRAGAGWGGGVNSWILMAPSAAAIAIYALVYAEPRHLAPFVLLLYLGGVLALQIPDSAASRRVAGRAAAVMIAVFVLTVVVSIGRIAADGSPQVGDWQVVEGLRQAGIAPGIKVATLEYANHANVKWMRLARAKAVAEIYTTTFDPSEREFWSADEVTRARVLETFLRAGAEIVVSTGVPPDQPIPPGWHRIGKTGYFMLRLTRTP
ncbi:MAG: hypothetical protein ABI759_05920 [Candidatus Solibacter sp.]